MTRTTNNLSMASWLENGYCCNKNYWSVFEQNGMVNNVRVDDSTAKLVVIASNALKLSREWLRWGLTSKADHGRLMSAGNTAGNLVQNLNQKMLL